jgi:ribose-phosphate pyrophosphokinase
MSTRTAPIVFALPEYRAVLGAALGSCSGPALGSCSFARFSDGELHLRLHTAVEGRACVVLGSLAPPDERLLKVLLLADTLRRRGARRVVALLPYLGYGRQDRAEPGQSLGAAWAGALLRGVGVEDVITVDLHSARAAECLGLPVASLSPVHLFADALARRDLRDVTIVAPDEGALARCEALASAAHIEQPIAHLRKRRDASGVTHSGLVGKVTSRIVIVDDILDTGGTLVSACRALRSAGAEEITVMVTHGLFTGDLWRQLETLGVDTIFTTDSVPRARDGGGDMVEVLPIGQLLVDALARMTTDEGPSFRTAPLGSSGMISEAIVTHPTHGRIRT